MVKIRNILISGGAGFIGSNLTLKLIGQGYFVTVLDNLSEQIHGKNPENSFSYHLIKDKVKFIKGDVRNRKDWEKSLSGQDAIIHLAAETGTGQSMYEIFHYAEVNIGGTALLLDILAKDRLGIKKIVVASSRAIYGEGRYSCLTHGDVFPNSRNENDLKNGSFECRCPECGKEIKLLSTNEDSKDKPTSIYGISKHVQEQMFLVGGKSLSIPSVALRYQNVFGPGQSLSNPYTGILSIFSTQIRNNNPINIFEDGKESRDFVYIDDVVDATILSLNHEKANYNVYNVGSGRCINVLYLAKKLVELYQSNVQIRITGNFRNGDIRHNFADLTKIKNDLNFSPKYDFDNGLIEFIKWVNTQEIKTDNYTDSIKELEERGLIK